MDYYARRTEAMRQIVALINEGKGEKEIVGRIGYSLGLPPKTIIGLIDQAKLLERAAVKEESKSAEKEVEEVLGGLSK